jgi:hypothetical protein
MAPRAPARLQAARRARAVPNCPCSPFLDSQESRTFADLALSFGLENPSTLSLNNYPM